MTTKELESVFMEENDEFLKFDRVAIRHSSRPDLHAFILLDSLLSNSEDMISAAGHDEYYLSVSVEELAKVITKEQIVELRRCGIRYSLEYGCLCSFT